MSEIDVYKEWLGIPEGTFVRRIIIRCCVCCSLKTISRKSATNYRKLNAHVRKYSTGQYLIRSQELLNEMAKAMLCLTDPDGKREYDQSLGREPTESTMTNRRRSWNT